MSIKHVLAYNDEARSLAFTMQQKVPLLKWKPVLAKEVTESEVFNMMLHIRVEWTINGKDFSNEKVVAPEVWKLHRGWLIDTLANSICHELGESVREWKPQRRQGELRDNANTAEQD